jgi:hypothetical protein
MLRHAVKLRANPKAKVMLETRRVYWDGAMAYKGLKREEKDLAQSSQRAEHRGHGEVRDLQAPCEGFEFALILCGKEETDNAETLRTRSCAEKMRRDCAGWDCVS